MDMQTYIDTHSQDTDTETDAEMNTANLFSKCFNIQLASYIDWKDIAMSAT